MFTAAMQTVQKQKFLKSVKNSYIRNSQKPIAISVNTDKGIAISVNKINTIAISVNISYFISSSNWSIRLTKENEELIKDFS